MLFRTKREIHNWHAVVSISKLSQM